MESVGDEDQRANEGRLLASLGNWLLPGAIENQI